MMKGIIQKLLRTQILALLLLGFLLYPQAAWYRDIIRGVSAALYLLYVPGYWISHLFFATKEVSNFERFVMSLALSLMLVIFISFYLHYFAIPVYPIYLYVFILVFVFLSFFFLLLRKKS